MIPADARFISHDAWAAIRLERICREAAEARRAPGWVSVARAGKADAEAAAGQGAIGGGVAVVGEGQNKTTRLRSKQGQADLFGEEA